MAWRAFSEGIFPTKRLIETRSLVERSDKGFWTTTATDDGLQDVRLGPVVLNGIELLHMIRKGQLAPRGLGAPKTAAEQFYQLAA